MDEADRSSMSYGELLAWAWRETPPVHKSRANLLIHLFAVPLFVLGHVLIIAAPFVDLQLLIGGMSTIIVSLILQNIGHKLERVAPPPFLGPKDFLRRLYAEQFCNFWRFLFSGGWYASFKAAT
ncbi:MAG: terminase [Pseudomonadota bacterium]